MQAVRAGCSVPSRAQKMVEERHETQSSSSRPGCGPRRRAPDDRGCAGAHCNSGTDSETAQIISAMAKPVKTRNLGNVALRSLRAAAFLHEFSICGASGSPCPARPGVHHIRRPTVIDESYDLVDQRGCRRSQPWLALQVPLQDPWDPWPRQVPPPRPFESRPDPCALWPALETLTLTWPDELTRPETLTAPPPR